MWAGHKVRRVGAGWRQPFADSKTAAGRRVRVAPASRHVAGRGGVVESSGFILGLAALEEKPGRNVFGGTPNTASGTHALPGIVYARSVPLKTSSYQVNQGQSRSIKVKGSYYDTQRQDSTAPATHPRAGRGSQKRRFCKTNPNDKSRKLFKMSHLWRV